MFKLLMLIAFAAALMVSPAVAKPQFVYDLAYPYSSYYSPAVAYNYYPYAYSAYGYPFYY